MNAVPDLPHEVLVLVLQHVPQAQRLTGCAPVARRWQAAAVAATPSIQLQSSKEARHAGLLVYLAKHGQHVTSLDLDSCCEASPGSIPCGGGGGPGPGWNHCSRQLELAGPFMRMGPLPCPQLQSLQLQGIRVRLAAEEGGLQPGDLQACTQLTRLSLGAYPVLQAATCSTAGLSAITDLQHLSLSGRLEWGRCAALPPSLAAALARGQPQLTHLALRDFEATDASLQHISRLTSLSRLHLELDRLGSRVTPAALFAGLEQLPQLTALALPRSRLCISSSTAPGLSQMTGLQHLDLQHCEAVQHAVLTGLAQLRHLELAGVVMKHKDASALLVWIGRLRYLRHLGLNGSLQALAAGPAAAYAALTASSALEHLDLAGCMLPAGAWAHMLPQEEGRRLPQLRTLNFKCCLPDCCDLGLSGEELAGLVRCCRGLHSLHAGVQLGAPLTALQRLQQLTSLSLSGVNGDTVRPLAQLTGLAHLRVDSPSSSSSSLQGCAALMALTQLTQLHIGGIGTPGRVDHIDIDIRNRAPAGTPPDVSARLRHAICPSSLVHASTWYA